MTRSWARRAEAGSLDQMPAKFNRVRSVAAEAVSAGVVPGVVVGVGQGGGTVAIEAFGDRAREPAPAPAAPGTVYDLASLSKALATAVLTTQAVAEGRLGLDERLDHVLAAAEGRPCAAATVRALLSHSAGLAAHRPFYEGRLAPGARPWPDGAGRVLTAAADEPLVYAPGTRSLYSDLGFILLGAALESRLGAPLDTLFATRVAARAGASPIGFLPVGRPPPPSAPAPSFSVAPTERCPVRGRLVAREVHDLNAYAMGGVAGHAGLFGDAAAVLAIANALVAAWRGTGTGAPLVDRDVLRTFWTAAGVPGSNWRLGWDGPAVTGSLAGDRIDRRAVGHLAFTGPSIWIDPHREVVVLVLTNRVHPTVTDDPRWRQLRPALTDAALADVGY